MGPPPALWKSPSHRGLAFSSGWARVSRSRPSPMAASSAPQPRRTRSERRPAPGLFLQGAGPGAWPAGPCSHPPSVACPSLLSGMQR